jgi:hypothetical protein
MAHEPCGFQGDAKGPVKLVTRNALLRRAHEICGLKPIVHRHMASLKNGADFYAKWLTALIAFVDTNTGAFAAHLGNAIDAPAMRACWAGRPQSGFNPSVSGGFVMKGFCINDRSGHGGQFPFMKSTISQSGGYVNYK